MQQLLQLNNLQDKVVLGLKAQLLMRDHRDDTDIRNSSIRDPYHLQGCTAHTEAEEEGVPWNLPPPPSPPDVTSEYLNFKKRLPLRGMILHAISFPPPTKILFESLMSVCLYIEHAHSLIVPWLPCNTCILETCDIRGNSINMHS